MAKENILTRNKKKKAEELIAQGKLSEAMVMLETICKKNRQDADAWFNLGIISGLQENFTKARECFEQVIRLKPNSTKAHINLAKALIPLGLYQEAVKAFRAVLDIKPDDLTVHQHLNATLVRSGKLNEAYAGYDRMLELSPQNPQIIAAKAKVLEIKGDKKQAQELLKPLITQYPDNPNIAIAYSGVCTEVGLRNDAIDRLETILENNQNRLQQEVLSNIHFCLGKLYDNNADYSKSFSHYLQANTVNGRTFDIAMFAKAVDDIINKFSADALEKTPVSTIPTDSAIFIIGMPRSGTSLVEQILASHPDVGAAGELYEITRLMTDISDLVDSRNPFPNYLDDLTSDICNTIAQRYLDRLVEISPTSRYVTNKMPQNFLLLGLISILFPQAHIIHCQRDPIDTCVSCFFQDFNQGHEYAYNLETLGAYYRQYRKLMDHWDKVINRTVFTIRYEELVANQESQTRRMLEFLDLPWNEACLNFYTNERVVPTASYDQVRQPIYNKSVGRWKHYEPYIQPLIKAITE